MNTPHPRMVPAQPGAVPIPNPTIYQEPPEEKVDFKDVMPAVELPAPDVPPDPTLVELIALDIKSDGRRATDYSHLLK